MQLTHMATLNLSSPETFPENKIQVQTFYLEDDSRKYPWANEAVRQERARNLWGVHPPSRDLFMWLELILLGKCRQSVEGVPECYLIKGGFGIWGIYIPPSMSHWLRSAECGFRGDIISQLSGLLSAAGVASFSHQAGGRQGQCTPKGIPKTMWDEFHSRSHFCSGKIRKKKK